MDWITRPDAWIALATLTVLEVVLGIDNIVFISILSEKVAPHERAQARRLGLAIAMLSRIALLFSIVWVMRLTAPLFSLLGHPASGRDLILIGGGLFLLFKATREIHERLEGEGPHHDNPVAPAKLSGVIVQIAILDMVFSLDSVITAVGMADDIGVMVSAVVIAVALIMLAAEPVSHFVSRHPTVKMLALSFLPADRHVTGGRRPRAAHLQGLHLLRDGLLGVRRGAQSVDGKQEGGGAGAAALLLPGSRW